MSSSILRRRGKLAPLQRALQQNITNTTNTTNTTSGTNSSFPFQVVFVSPCQIAISNDPDTSPSLFEEIPCNVTQFLCTDANISTPSGNPDTLFVDFDYEMHYTVGADFNLTVEALEGAMLQHLASFTGLEDCPVPSLSNTFGQRRLEDSSTQNRRLQFFTTEEKAAFVGVSSNPVDIKDPNFNDCIVAVDSATVPNTVCQPMTGTMTAQVNVNLGLNPSLEESLRTGVLELVRQGMIDDTYVSGNLKKASFVGTRVAQPVVNPNANSVAEGDSATLSSVGIAFICVGGVMFFLLFFALFAFRRRHNRLKEERGVVFVDATIPPDEILGSDVAVNDGSPEWHQRSSASAEDVDGAEVPGSLAAMDTLALRPSPTAEEKKRFQADGDTPDSKRSIDSTAQPVTPRRTDVPDEPAPPKTPETGVLGEDSYVTPRATRRVPRSMDQTDAGTDLDVIMNDLLADTSEGVDVKLEDDDDSVHKLVRIA